MGLWEAFTGRKAGEPELSVLVDRLTRVVERAESQKGNWMPAATLAAALLGGVLTFGGTAYLAIVNRQIVDSQNSVNKENAASQNGVKLFEIAVTILNNSPDPGLDPLRERAISIIEEAFPGKPFTTEERIQLRNRLAPSNSRPVKTIAPSQNQRFTPLPDNFLGPKIPGRIVP